MSPYLHEIAESFIDPAVEIVCFVTAAQMAKTELVFNLIGHTVTDRPRPVIYVGPTQDQVREVSRDRIDKMLRLTPCLRDTLDPRASHQTTYERHLNGVKVSFAWAGSATQLASRPAAIVLVDERDRMGADVGGEGDPVELARARTKNFFNRKIGIFSTPTVEGASPIWEWFDAGTMKMWAWRCADCGHWFVPRLDYLVYPEDVPRTQIRNAARVACPGCGVEIDNDQRLRLEARFIPHVKNEAGDYEMVEEAAPNTVESFWVSGLASPLTSLGETAEVIAQAWSSKNQERIQTAINTFGGELYKLEGDSPGWMKVWEKRASYLEPAGVRLVTAGADVGKNDIHCVIRGYGWNAESWLLAHHVLHGETSYDDIWLALQTVLERMYCAQPVRLMLVDSGYAADQVYKFCRRHSRASPSKGHDRQDRPHKDTLVDERPSGRAVKAGIRLWHVDTDFYKSWVYGRIRWPDGEPGDWHVPMDITENYARQVTNEQLVVMSSGRRVWRTTGDRQNHFLDAEVLAACAAHIHNVHSLPREVPVAPNPSPKAPNRRPDPRLERRGL